MFFSRTLFLLLALSLRLTAQTIVYVDADTRGGTGSRDGSSWENAFPRLFDALALTTGPAEIWVAEGTYRPSDVLDRGDTYTLVDGVGLYGGFNGTESLREEADPDAHPTILTGDLMLDDDSGGSNAENSYHVLHCPSGNVALDGFTIHGGNTTGDASNPYGGGVYGAGSLTFTNCLFRGNRANGGTTGGGAVYHDSGAGIYSFSHCRFEDNSTSKSGGAISSFGTSALLLSDCVFVGNESLDDGGGVYWGGGSSATSFVRCTFDSNQADRGGGLAIGTSLPAIVIEECSFLGNIATRTGTFDFGGGGVYSGSGPTFISCLFAGNTSGCSGGGVSGLGSMFINCAFLGNTAADRGGGLGTVFDATGGYTLINCTFQGNRVDAADRGGAVYGSDTVFENCILWNNEAGGITTSPGASFRGSTGIAETGDPVLTNSLAQGWDLPGTGNIDGTDLANAPLFLSPVDPASAPHLTGDLRLLATSPGLDAGDNSLNSEAFDIAGLARVQNTNIDMGAYEAIPAAEITVFDGGANELSDNGAPLDLGVLRLEDLATTVDFTIENPSIASLTGVGVTASGPSAPDVSVSIAPAATVSSYTSSAFQITLTLDAPGPVDATLAIASNDADENPFDIPLVGLIASDLTDADSDGLSDYQDLLNGTDPGDPDSDADGVLDGAEIALSAFGFSEGVDDSALLAALQGNAPSVGLYTESNLQALALDRPVISRDAVTGNFTIATGLLQSPDLGSVPFVPLTDYTPTYDPGSGELLLEFAAPTPDAHFFQVFGKLPTP